MQETARAEITEFLLAKVKELFQESSSAVAELTSTTHLQDAGIDSIQFINFIVQVEQKYQVFFEDDEMKLSRLQTVDEIATLLLQKL
jgi:acyl carrier protein